MRRICCALGLLVSLTLTGCGESGPVLVEAGGKVTYNNAPVANATVRFLPADGSKKDSPFGMGTTDKDGNFELKVRGDKGVPEGVYDVTVTK
ncbi:MAG: hypothetical protein NT069_18990, partial [Planctomycetota bacterium]|nr:hypothetical protein [Planctomycetota bacterium]